MTDIVERLRGEHWWLNVDGKEVADEIERYRGDGVGSIKRAYADGYAAAQHEIERLQAELKEQGAREVAAWVERDQYLESNVKLAAEIERLQKQIKDLD